MRIPGRVSAAIDVLTEVLDRHRPASEVLRDWGKAHRFAGGGDRHSIGTLVYDALRQRNSAAFRMGSDKPRALVLATLVDQWNMTVEQVAQLSRDEYGPPKLSDTELIALAREQHSVPGFIYGNIPEWLWPSFENAFAGEARHEGRALASRAPIDLRVNSLKSNREAVVQALSRFSAKPGPLSPLCVRIAAPSHDARNINVEAEPAHGMGWFEVQDAASQVAALMSGAGPGEIVADICAGAGGKTLALAAMMQNQGRLVAHDRDRHRLRPIFERIARSGAGTIEVLAAKDSQKLETFGGFDCVVIDAPCSGSGSWRRKPDAKWKLNQKTLDMRIKEQREILARGAKLVRPGGRLVYITCSVLPEENTDQTKLFLAKNPEFKSIAFAEQWQKAIGSGCPKSADGKTEALVLTPYQHQTDGFFIAVFRRA